MGDPLFPDLGNGGYDVTSYDIAITADTTNAAITARTIITATATQDLSAFDLDLHGFAISALTVDGVTAPFTRDADEIVVNPLLAIATGQRFVVSVAYAGAPDPLPDPDIGHVGWLRAGTTTYVVGEPNGAHAWFPGSDHPSDKASFVFHLDVPAGVTAVANGVLREKVVDGARAIWTWDQREPMATYLAGVAIGDLTVHTSDGPHGILLRNVFATRLDAAAVAATARTGEMITVLESMFGPYPFATYGALIVDAQFSFALEVQTLSLFSSSIATTSMRSERIQVHELAHQWFGDSLALTRWQDIWLNEGFASYAEALWFERTMPGYDIDREMRTYANAGYGPIGHPSGADLFGDGEYRRGALVLHALRRTIGDTAFFAALQDYATSYSNGNVDTASFITVVNRHTSQPMNDFFQQWLDAPHTPPLPF